MEPRWRLQSQRASSPATLLNVNQQAERPTLLLGDWEEGQWLVCRHWSLVLLTVSELTQVSSYLSPLSGPANVLKWNETAVEACGSARKRLSAAVTTTKPAHTPNQYISIHRKNEPLHNYSYWNGNYPLNELEAVPLKPVFPCWEENIFVAEWRPFSRHLIAIGRSIPCDIYENFMDGSCFRLWHFGFPLKVWMWWLFFFSSHQDCKWKQQALRWRKAPMKEERKKGRFFISSGNVINRRWWRQ